MAADAFVSAFINANILIIVAFLLWSAARLVLSRIVRRDSSEVQLRLLNAVFIAIALSPLVGIAPPLLHPGSAAGTMPLNLSDMVIAHYLNGGFNIPASDFERLMNFRFTFVNDVVNAAGWLARTVIILFALSVAIGALRLAYSMICLYRIVSGSFAWRQFGRVRLRLSDRTLVPFSTRGIRYYYVVIPAFMLGQRDDLRVSLAHEFQHLRQGDIDWEIVLEALKPFFFLNPAYHAWKRQVENLRELSCDAQVLRRGRIEVRQYCQTLLSVCQTSLRRDRIFVTAVPKVTLVTADRSAISGPRESLLHRRVTSLLDAGRLRYPRLVTACATLPLVTAILILAVAIQRPADWSHDRLMLSTVVNLERMDEINRLSTFGRLRD